MNAISMVRKSNAAAVMAFCVLTCGSAAACSPYPDASILHKTEEPRYNFVATVVDEELVEDPRRPGKKMVASLRFRVVSSQDAELAPGMIVALGYQYTGSTDSMCRRMTRELTLRDWSAGTRVRILSNDLHSAESIFTTD